jgi:hypothetical protein
LSRRDLAFDGTATSVIAIVQAAEIEALARVDREFRRREGDGAGHVSQKDPRRRV